MSPTKHICGFEELQQAKDKQEKAGEVRHISVKI